MFTPPVHVSIFQWLSGHCAPDPMARHDFVNRIVHDAVTPKSLAAPILEL
jgi:hypothetical protein